MNFTISLLQAGSINFLKRLSDTQDVYVKTRLCIMDEKGERGIVLRYGLLYLTQK